MCQYLFIYFIVEWCFIVWVDHFCFSYNNQLFKKHIFKKLLTVAACREGNERQRDKDEKKTFSLFTIWYGFNIWIQDYVISIKAK